MTKILLIDDDETLRTIMREVLTDKGYAVIEATDAPSGYAVAVAEKPDVIMSDFIMPGIPGKNVFEELAADSQTKDIPILIISGMPKEKIQGYIPQELWPDILTKPIEYSLLAGYIEGALKRKKAGAGWFSSLFRS